MGFALVTTLTFSRWLRFIERQETRMTRVGALYVCRDGRGCVTMGVRHRAGLTPMRPACT